MNVAAEALSRSKIRKLVREFRKAIGCEKMEYFPIVQFIEWILANPESGMDFEIVDPGEMQDTYGTTNTEKNVMRIRSDVYEGAVKGRPRDRFTLCHELGHYILHMMLWSMRWRADRSPKPERQRSIFTWKVMQTSCLRLSEKRDSSTRNLLGNRYLVRRWSVE